MRKRTVILKKSVDYTGRTPQGVPFVSIRGFCTATVTQLGHVPPNADGEKNEFHENLSPGVG